MPTPTDKRSISPDIEARGKFMKFSLHVTPQMTEKKKKRYDQIFKEALVGV